MEVTIFRDHDAGQPLKSWWALQGMATSGIRGVDLGDAPHAGEKNRLKPPFSGLLGRPAH
ncbi:hypothetical protein D3C87_714140 [compost metagenome]